MFPKCIAYIIVLCLCVLIMYHKYYLSPPGMSSNYIINPSILCYFILNLYFNYLSFAAILCVIVPSINTV